MYIAALVCISSAHARHAYGVPHGTYATVICGPRRATSAVFTVRLASDEKVFAARVQRNGLPYAEQVERAAIVQYACAVHSRKRRQFRAGA